MGKTKTRRGGVKYRARKTLLQFRLAPADSENVGVEEHYDAEYERLFAAHNPSIVPEFERREGYHPRRPWPFQLVELTLEPLRAVAGIPLDDPRHAVYSSARTPPTIISTPHYG